MNYQQQNGLLNSYRNYQQRNNPFQNNILLQNNASFKNNLNHNKSQQMQQLQMMHNSRMRQYQEIQKIKQIEKLNNLNKKYKQEDIIKAVIRPNETTIKVNDPELMARIKLQKKVDIDKYLTEKVKENKNNLGKFWNQRTNQPYKNIIKDSKYIDKFINRKKINEEELIVHKITDADKEGVDDEFIQLQGTLEKHNNELKVIYSSSKEAEHKKKFEYNHKYKYRVKYNPSDHNVLKNEKYYKRQQKKEISNKEKVNNIVNYYKQEQQKMEGNNNEIVDSLIDNGIFNKDELEQYCDNNTNISKEDKRSKYIARQK